MPFGLMGTFHSNQGIRHTYPHRIKPDHLANGIRNGLLLNGSRYAKVLQFVVNEVHFVS